MTKVGIKQLKEQASEIARRVREKQESFEWTYRGEVFAEIRPVHRPIDLQTDAERWQELEQLMDDISKHWQGDLDAVEAVNDVRRVL